MINCSCAIHQPHYFPWMGYLNKIASVDKFIVLDCVQLEKGSNMYRNKLITNIGLEKHITIAFEKKGYLDINFNEIVLDKAVLWQEKQKNFIVNNYKKKRYFTEIWDRIEPIFSKKYTLLHEVVEESMKIELDIFGISTEIIYQSQLAYNPSLRKNEMLINLCHLICADMYLSGMGAMKYVNTDIFNERGIEIYFQNFSYPTYEQGTNFVPNLSGLDILFNCGIEESRNIFWKTVNDIYKKR